ARVPRPRRGCEWARRAPPLGVVTASPGSSPGFLASRVTGETGSSAHRSGPPPRQGGTVPLSQIFETEFGGRTLTIETGKLARLAGGSVTVRYGDTMVLGTANRSEPR